MIILVLNAGSSSLKYQLIDMTNEQILGKGMVDRIGIDGSVINQSVGDLKIEIKKPINNHSEAVALMIEALTDSEKGAIKNLEDIGAVGHRIVHGGEDFTESALIDAHVKSVIAKNAALSPLHNKAHLMGIEACEAVMPSVPGVAVFDTAFHQTMTKEAYLYGIPMDYYRRLRIRRYGFHGTSHKYVSERACKFLGLDINNSKIITCHLGNGSSITAIKNGKCVDTSMGLTPLEGVMMGTRSGNIDPAVVTTIMHNEGVSLEETMEILNKKSGLLGISELSSDMRDIDDGCDAGNEKAILARKMLGHSVRKYIGAYAAVLNGVDVIVFTAGMGENNHNAREAVVQNLDYLGAVLDKEKNITRSEAIISTDDSKVKIVVIPTDEEIVIARDTHEIVTKL